MEEITRWRSTFDLAMVAMTSAREVWKLGHVETGELEIEETCSASVFDVSSSKLLFHEMRDAHPFFWIFLIHVSVSRAWTPWSMCFC